MDIQSYKKLLLTTLVIAPLAACSSKNSNPDEALSWSGCEEAAALFECSTLQVPMDHTVPNGKQIDIALMRHRATGPQRLGSLFVNFGGASGRGVEDVQLGQNLLKHLHPSYLVPRQCRLYSAALRMLSHPSNYQSRWQPPWAAHSFAQSTSAISACLYDKVSTRIRLQKPI